MNACLLRSEEEIALVFKKIIIFKSEKYYQMRVG